MSARSAFKGRADSSANAALQAALTAGLAGYDRVTALARFHRLPAQTIAAQTPEAARAVLLEIERAMRRERARAGHWTYDLNRHIGLLVAYRAEKARLDALSGEKSGSGVAGNL